MPSLKLIIFSLILIIKSAIGNAAVLVKEKLWPKNTQLIVVFIDGNEQQKSWVKKIAPLWLKDTRLTFKFYTGFTADLKESHIRISFTGHTGSELGDHGDYFSREPTLLLNRLNQEFLVESEVRRLILHEFGHALGFEHEYRNPSWPYGQDAINQQIQDCIPRLQQIGYLLKEAQTKCGEINHVLSPEEVHATIYDEYSIMNYPQKILLKGNRYKIISRRFELSVLDKLAMERWYN